jgi:RsiW-degrading membrane proteinase PrsW (M82 family)
MFCPRCGTENLPEHKFCKSCGTPTTQSAGSAADSATGPAVAPANGAVPLAVPHAQPVPPPPGFPPPAGGFTAAAGGFSPAAGGFSPAAGGFSPAAGGFSPAAGGFSPAAGGFSPAAGGFSPAAGTAIPPPPYPGYPHPIYYVQAPTAQQTTLLHGLRARIQNLASTEELEGFSLKAMFSEVFKRRSAEAVEDYILVGTSKTTPPIDLVETGWPKPWLFFRLLAALVVAYVALTFLFMRTGNSNCLPGMMFLGAFAVPLATLVLFFELNTPRIVSLHTIGKLFLLGAIVSLAVALLGYSLPIFDLSDMEAGIVEEVAKLLTVVLVMRSVRYKYILNGILFGATVGAGFAAFETAGYALNEGLVPGLLQGLVQTGQMSQAMHGGAVAMLQVLRLRGIEAPLGHVAWTALAAGAFWRVKLGKPMSPAMLFDTRFLKAFMIPVLMHAIWDAPWQLPFQGNQILTGLVTWYVVFGLVQQGLRQVKEEQKAHLENTLEHVEASMQPTGAVLA